MEVTEALAARRSIRDFRTDPIGRDTLAAVMQAALHSPSWANTQPWQVYIAAGEPLERMREAFGKNFSEGVERNSDLPRPESWPPRALELMEELRDARMRQLEEDAGSGAVQAREDMGALNQVFFRAPAVAYLCMDRSLTSWSVFDLGMLAQSIMLAATEAGLGSIPAYNLVVYPDILRRELDIPEELLIVIGIALGYADESSPHNRFRSPRRGLDDVVRFRGV